MNTTVISFAAFAAGACAAYAGWLFTFERFLKDRLRINRRLSSQFPTTSTQAKSSLFKDLRLFQDETSRTEKTRWQRFEEEVAQSGVTAPPARIVAFAVGFAGVLGIATFFLIHWSMAFVAAAMGGWLPFAYVLAKRRKRIAALCEQLPDAFELMSRAVRAGQTIPSAMQLVATQTKAPLGPEFAHCCEQQNLGLPPAIAMGDLAKRTGVVELQFFVVAMLVQRQAGGSPVDILDNLSDMIRNRIRLQGKVRALTGEGRMQATVLSLLPAVALAALWVLNRQYAEILFARPWVLLGILASQAVGGFWIRRIVNFDF